MLKFDDKTFYYVKIMLDSDDNSECHRKDGDQKRKKFR